MTSITHVVVRTTTGPIREHVVAALESDSTINILLAPLAAWERAQDAEHS
jgi:hypothetical protein